MGLYNNRRKIYEALDTTMGRPVLAVVASLYRSAIYHHPCFVWYHDGEWIHRQPDGYLVERQIMLRPISAFNQMNSDYYLYTYRLRPGDLVIDCGASTGWETLLFSRLVGPTGRVISVEAHPIAYRCLTEMCRRNNLANVTPLECAVGENGGTATITDLPNHLSNTIVSGDGEGLTVNVRTLDDITADLRRPVDLIKINVEGAELAALRGAEETLRSTRHLAVSCHDFIARRGFSGLTCTKAEVHALLEERGFHVTERSDDPREWVADFLYADRPLRKARDQEVETAEIEQPLAVR